MPYSFIYFKCRSDGEPCLFSQKEGCYYASEKYDKLNQQTIYEVTQMPGEIITIPSG